MAQRRITMKLDIGPGRAQLLDTSGHGGGGGDAILFPDDGKGRRLLRLMIGMAGIGHYHGGGLRQGVSAECGDTVRADARDHAGTG